MQALSKTDENLLRSKLVEPEIAAILDTHSNEIKHVLKVCNEHTCKKIRHAVWEFPWLPGYIIKYSIDRIVGAELIRTCIDTYNLDLLTVPDKFLYHVPGRAKELTNLNYLVVEKKLEVDFIQSPFSLEQTKQMCTLIKVTGYIDAHKNNVLRLKNKKLAFIDTEKELFSVHKNYVGLYHLIIGYGRYNIETDFTTDALKHILKEIAALCRKNPRNFNEAYHAIDVFFKGRRRPLKWDYQSYFEAAFAQ